MSVDAPDCRLVSLGERHVSSMLRIFNDCVADGFAADPEKPLSEEEMADIGRQTSGHATVAADALNQGITRILAHSSSRNPGSLALHAKHGFVECGRVPSIGRKWDQPFDVVWSVKSLGDVDRRSHRATSPTGSRCSPAGPGA